MADVESTHNDRFDLTPEHQMLLRMRDTLYEGSWDDFMLDLRARQDGQPHVFDTVPETPGMTATITRHLELIEEMHAWELSHVNTLSADDEH